MPQGKSSEKLDDGRWSHTFHQSGLSEVDLCPERGRIALLGQMPSLTSDSMALGTGVHEAIEYALTQQILGLPFDGGTMMQVFDQSIATQELIVYSKYNDENALFRTADKMVQAFLSEVWPGLDPFVVEHEFKIKVIEDAHRDIWFGGIIDYIGRDKKTLDWKTGEKRFQQWEQQRWSTQATMYSFAAKHLFGEGVGDHFEYVQMRPNGEISRCVVKRDEGHWTWLIKKAIHLAVQVEAELESWTLNDTSWACSDKWCGNWSACKGAVVGVDWSKTVK